MVEPIQSFAHSKVKGRFTLCVTVQESPCVLRVFLREIGKSASGVLPA